MNWHDLLQPEYVWMVVGLLLLILEFAIPGLVISFFGAGAIVVGILLFAFDLSLNAQLVVFLASSIGLLVTLRDAVARAWHHDQTQRCSDELEEIVGQHAQVIQDIGPQAAGRVEFHGSPWKAESLEAIPAGSTVTVVGRDNLTLIVTREQPV